MSPLDQERTDQNPVLSMSLDLDNLWSYLKVHGDASWKVFPSYLEDLSSIVLERLAAHNLTISVFVVGQDADREENQPAIRAFSDAGHEIANHSFHHEPWLHTYSPEELDTEIARAEEALSKVTDQPVRGFRGPGFSLSLETLEVLAARGYQYDASTFPTFLGPLARAHYFRQSRSLTESERAQRKRLFGKFSEGFRPLDPYIWTLGENRIVEIPVTTMPALRLPFHLSYLLYIASKSRFLFRTYLRIALEMCRVTGTEPSFLLHPLDFLGGDRVSRLDFFPAMNLDTVTKLELFDFVVTTLKRRYTIVTMQGHARLACRRDRIARVSAEAAFAAR